MARLHACDTHLDWLRLVRQLRDAGTLAGLAHQGGRREAPAAVGMAASAEQGVAPRQAVGQSQQSGRNGPLHARLDGTAGLPPGTSTAEPTAAHRPTMLMLGQLAMWLGY